VLAGDVFRAPPPHPGPSCSWFKGLYYGDLPFAKTWATLRARCAGRGLDNILPAEA